METRTSLPNSPEGEIEFKKALKIMEEEQVKDMSHQRKALILRHLKKSIEQNYAEAKRFLSVAMLDGQLVKKDEVGAFHLMVDAADSGSRFAKIVLGMMVNGIPKSCGCVVEQLVARRLLANPTISKELNDPAFYAKKLQFQAEDFIRKLTGVDMSLTFSIDKKSESEEQKIDKTRWFTDMLAKDLDSKYQSEQISLAAKWIKDNSSQQTLNTAFKFIEKSGENGVFSAQAILGLMIFNANRKLLGEKAEALQQKTDFFNPHIVPECFIADSLERNYTNFVSRLNFYDKPEDMRYAVDQLKKFFKLKYDTILKSIKPLEEFPEYEERRKWLDDQYRIAISSLDKTLDAYLKFRNPNPEFKSEIFRQVAVKKEHIGIADILEKDPLFPLKSILEFVYNAKHFKASPEFVLDLQKHAHVLAKYEKTPEFWRLLCNGFMYGKGQEFFSHLHKLGLTENCFGKAEPRVWEYMEMRAKQIDDSLKQKNRPLFIDGDVYKNYVYGMIIAKELKPGDVVNEKTISPIIKKFNMPLESIDTVLLHRIQLEMERMHRFCSAARLSIQI